MTTNNEQPAAEKLLGHQENRELIDVVAASEVFRKYERAFNEATGLPVSLRPVESWQLPNHGKRNENPICALLAEKSRACAACLRLQQKLSESAHFKPATVTCHMGLCDTAVPVRLGGQLIGFLQTGQVLRRRARKEQIERTAGLMSGWGIEISRERLAKLYAETKVLSAKRYDSMVNLLSIFAEHLSMVSNRIMVGKKSCEPPAVTKAKEFITQHQTEDISLGQTAKAVNMSIFYFCKMFKKATGLNFTDYVSRMRIEKARNLLLNRNLRISEIAYEIGFQSLTHFNRVFRRIVGQSPTKYRGELSAV